MTRPPITETTALPHTFPFVHACRLTRFGRPVCFKPMPHVRAPLPLSLSPWKYFSRVSGVASAAAARRSRRSDSGGETVSETCEVRESSETWERESLGTSAITAVHGIIPLKLNFLCWTVVL